MKKIVVKKRHSIRKSHGRVAGAARSPDRTIGKPLPRGDDRSTGTNANVSLFMVGKKPLLMATDDLVFPTLKGAVQLPFPVNAGRPA